MLEHYEEAIENWWFKHYAKKKDTDLRTYLCVERVKGGIGWIIKKLYELQVVSHEFQLQVCYILTLYELKIKFPITGERHIYK